MSEKRENSLTNGKLDVAWNAKWAIEIPGSPGTVFVPRFDAPAGVYRAHAVHAKVVPTFDCWGDYSVDKKGKYYRIVPASSFRISSGAQGKILIEQPEEQKPAKRAA